MTWLYTTNERGADICINLATIAFVMEVESASDRSRAKFKIVFSNAADIAPLFVHGTNIYDFLDEAKWPMIPAEPGWYVTRLWDEINDGDENPTRERIIGWVNNPESIIPVTALGATRATRIGEAVESPDGRFYADCQRFDNYQAWLAAAEKEIEEFREQHRNRKAREGEKS